MNIIAPNLKVESLIKDPKREITIFETNIEKKKLMVPKKITWDQIKLLADWTLNRVCPVTTPVFENLQQIEEMDGESVRIKFNPSRSVLTRPNLVKGLARASTSAIADNISTYTGIKKMLSGIARPSYGLEEGEDSTPARPISPTLSNMGYSTVNMLKKVEDHSKVISKEFLKEFW